MATPPEYLFDRFEEHAALEICPYFPFNLLKQPCPDQRQIVFGVIAILLFCFASALATFYENKRSSADKKPKPSPKIAPLRPREVQSEPVTPIKRVSIPKEDRPKSSGSDWARKDPKSKVKLTSEPLKEEDISTTLGEHGSVDTGASSTQTGAIKSPKIIDGETAEERKRRKARVAAVQEEYNKKTAKSAPLEKQVAKESKVEEAEDKAKEAAQKVEAQLKEAEEVVADVVEKAADEADKEIAKKDSAKVLSTEAPSGFRKSVKKVLGSKHGKEGKGGKDEKEAKE